MGIAIALVLLVLTDGGRTALGVARAGADHSPSAPDRAFCSPRSGAPPIRTDEPVTIPPLCVGGDLLAFPQQDVLRYACLNAPAQARAEPHGRQWPLLVYLHGSLTTPDSLYLLGHALVGLHDTFPLSGDPDVQGFYVLSPEGRRATPWPSDGGPQTGTGFHWDEWYRNAASNLDALAIDHFVEGVLATGLIDRRRIYVFGWSNGAYMAALYGVWRGDRTAAIGQYAGADPWSRSPCPVALEAPRQVPLVLLRNLCDALVPCDTTAEWIDTLTRERWPFEFHNLSLLGAVTARTTCARECPRARGLFEHIRWPDGAALEELLRFFQRHPLP